MAPAAKRTPALGAPSTADVERLAAGDLLHVSAAEADDLLPSVAELVAIVGELLALPEAALAGPDPGDRSPGRRPQPGEDPFNAFTQICDIAGAASGPLAGARVGIKDNIDVAGVPTSNASATLPYTPTADAVVVERILGAGGRIVGKLNMDDYASGATGETSAFGPPRNPVDPTRSAGGSSGGSGAAVGSGAVDYALGGDQGGSARIPGSYCGVVALKATHGLIPSHGMTHLGHTIDYVCPMARSVAEVATLLGVVAGDDWRDPQWVRGPIAVDDYLAKLEDGDLAGLRIGVVAESVRAELCDDAVRRNLEATAEQLRAHGAAVETIDVPLWLHGAKITQTLLAHLTSAMIRNEGEGRDHLGLVSLERAASFSRKRRSEGALFPPYIKAWMITDGFLGERLEGTAYGVLHNLRLQVRRALDEALDDHDLLLTPTTPTTAPRLLTDDAAAEEIVGRVLGSAPYNTAPTNLSGHPALAVPNGADADGLPTSAQVIGRRFDEALVLRVGRVIELGRTTTGGA